MEPFCNSQYDDWADDDNPRWYRFIHAGRLLLAWREVDSLPISADLYMDGERIIYVNGLKKSRRILARLSFGISVE